MLAEIFMLRMELLARLTDEPPTGRFAPVPPALHWDLSRVSHALAMTIRNQGHSFLQPDVSQVATWSGP